jgi:nicotinic acid phosphoribosyltransferase
VLKKKKAKKLTATKVQTIVNAAIRRVTGSASSGTETLLRGRLDGESLLLCRRMLDVPVLSAEHHTQCFGHHGIHEHGREPFFYRRWMQEYRPDALEFMETHWGAVIKYDQETLHEIKRLAETDDLDGLQNT